MHREMVIAAAESGARAIHSEKPMAPTWGDAKAMVQACVDHGVTVTFCHQRRFERSFKMAKSLVREGAIGQLIRVEGACPNLLDWGTHWFDMFFFYNDDAPAEVGAGADRRFRKSAKYSAWRWKLPGFRGCSWRNGLEGLLATGDAALKRRSRTGLIGTDGIIEVIGGRDRPPIRIMRSGSDWEVPDLPGPQVNPTVLSVLDLIDCVKTGREPVLSGRKALQATELIFATYESSRRRGRVDLPLDVEDSALLTMLDEGTIGGEREAIES